MPITWADTNELKQDCLNCGAGHTMPLKQGYSKSKKEPYVLADGDTLEVKVDGEATPQSISLALADFADINAALASEVAAKINGVLAGAAADVDGGAVRIVSASTLMGVTCVEVTGGTAKDKLGFDGRKCGPRCLGVSKGTGANKQTAVDTMDLPHCPECGAKESLVRTWDVCPPGHENTLFAMHRKCTNALAEHLKAQGYSDPDAKPTHDAETGGPPDIDPAYPPGPVTLPSTFATSPDEPGGA